MLRRYDESLEMLLQVRRYAESVGVAVVSVDGVRFYLTDRNACRVYVCPATQRFFVAEDADGSIGAAFAELDGILGWCLFDAVSIAGEIAAKMAGDRVGKTGIEDPAKGVAG